MAQLAKNSWKEGTKHTKDVQSFATLSRYIRGDKLPQPGLLILPGALL